MALRAIKNVFKKKSMYGYQNQKSTGTRLGWYPSNKIKLKKLTHNKTLHKYITSLCFTFALGIVYIYLCSIMKGCYVYMTIIIKE